MAIETILSNQQRKQQPQPPPVNSSKSRKRCSYCEGVCNLRCSKCKFVFYCSKSCQRSDWKVHKKTCCRPTTADRIVVTSKENQQKRNMDHNVKKDVDITMDATQASQDLYQLVKSMTLEEAKEQFYRAQNEIDQLSKIANMDENNLNSEETEEEEQENYQEEIVEDETQESVLNAEEKKVDTTDLVTDDLSVEPSSEKEDISKTMYKAESSINILKDTKPKKVEMTFSIQTNNEIDTDKLTFSFSKKEESPFRTTKELSSTCKWTYSIEDLVNISTYNITLTPTSTYIGYDEVPKSTESRTNPFNGLQATISSNQKFHNTTIPQQKDLELYLNSKVIPKDELKILRGEEVKIHKEQCITTVQIIAKQRKDTNFSVSTENKNLLASFGLEKEIITNSDVALRSLTIEGQCITFRLQYKNKDSILPGGDFFDENVLDVLSRERGRTSVEALNQIACRSCAHSLLQTPQPMMMSPPMDRKSNRHKLRDVLCLPTGQWDEITDYLTCYEGQPIINFSSSATSASKGLALEDECVVVLHQEDVAANVCVLAINGYGEGELDSTSATDAPKNIEESEEKVKSAFNFEPENGAGYRGRRAWRDNVGGATVCCVQCCATLGYASIENPDTFRLLKHRLTARIPSLANSSHADCFALNNCTSFIARELVRYAECQAVFTFVVVTRPESGVHGQTDRCLLLRLLSWNTKMAIGSNELIHEEGIERPMFRRITKLIYEEADNMIDLSSNADDPNAWTWGGVDLCCAPETISRRQVVNNTNVENSATKASAHIYLDQSEWDELKRSLSRGCTLFPTSVSNATVMLKLDGATSSHEKASLSMLSLP